MEPKVIKQRIDQSINNKNLAKIAFLFTFPSISLINENMLNDIIVAYSELYPKYMKGDEKAGIIFDEILNPYIKNFLNYLETPEVKEYFLVNNIKKNPFIDIITLHDNYNKRSFQLGIGKFIEYMLKQNLKVKEIFDDDLLISKHIEYADVAKNKLVIKPTQNSKPITFQTKLNSDQLKELCIGLNKANLFTIKINEVQLNDILNCITTTPLMVINNRLLAYLFSVLDDNEFICREWQSIIEKNKLFISIKDKLITANDLATAKSQYSKLGNPKGFETIDKIISAIKNIKVN